MKMFTCSIVWSGAGETADIEDRVVMAETANGARKSLSKKLRDSGLKEGVDFVITLIEAEDADEPPPPFEGREDW